MNNNFFCSWSGGKDSCLALYKAIEANLKPKRLLNMLNEEGDNSRSHNLPFSVLKAQAKSLDIPLTTKRTSWDDYEEKFIETIKEFKKEGIDQGVFGDIDLKENREWEEKVCSKAGLTARLPLWEQAREDLLNEFIELGFKTMIIVVNEDYLDKKYLGKIIDKKLIKEFKDIGIDPSGENGEYHTVVINGPIFNERIQLKKKAQLKHENYWFQPVKLINS